MTSYAEQMAAELIPNQTSSLVDVFESACQEYHSKPAFSGLGQTITFEQLDQLSAHLSAYLSGELGLKKGDSIAIQLPNITQYPIAVWAAWRAGLVIVNTNPMYTAREQLHQFNDSACVALIVLADLLPVTTQILTQTGIKKVIAVCASEMVDPSHAYQSDSEHIVGFSSALNSGKMLFERDGALPKVELAMTDLAALQYTGGTTGPSKGAMLTHSNLYCAMALARESLEFFEKGVDEISIAALPLYHIFGFMHNMIGTTLNGGLVVLIPDPRNVDSMVALMKAYPFTSMAGVNTLFTALMHHPEFDSIDFSHINGVIAGGTTLVKEIADEWYERSGARLYEGYGLSETCGTATCNRQQSYQLGSVGPSMLYVEVQTVNQDNQPVVSGERGEVLIRGPQVMQAYWNKKAATAEVIDSEGWFRTGDIGIVEGNGHLRIVDRIKDMIIVSGFNVYPTELEAVVYGHPNVVECAVIGIPDQNSGEAIKLFVVSNDKSIGEDNIRDFCRIELTGYKVPRHIVFMDDLPKSPAGKVLRRELREQ